MKILYTTARFRIRLTRGPINAVLSNSALGAKARDHVASFVEGPEEKEYIGQLKPYCVEVHTVPLPRWRSYASHGHGCFERTAFASPLLFLGRVSRRLQSILAKRKFDVIHTVLARPANHTIGVTSAVKVCEMIDAVSLTMKRRADVARGLAKWVWRMEAERMRRFEQRICKSFDGIVVLSEVDRQELSAPNVTVIPIGTDVSLRPRQSPNGHKVGDVLR